MHLIIRYLKGKVLQSRLSFAVQRCSISTLEEDDKKCKFKVKKSFKWKSMKKTRMIKFINRSIKHIVIQGFNNQRNLFKVKLVAG